MIKLQKAILSRQAYFEIGKAARSDRQVFLNRLVRMVKSKTFEVNNIKGNIIRATYYDDLEDGHIEIWMYNGYEIIPVRLPINNLNITV